MQQQLFFTKSYWELINDVKNKDNEDVQNDISSTDWLNHFKTLTSVNSVFSDRLKTYKEAEKNALLQ